MNGISDERDEGLNLGSIIYWCCDPGQVPSVSLSLLNYKIGYCEDQIRKLYKTAKVTVPGTQ